MDTMTSYYETKFHAFMWLKKDLESDESREELKNILDDYGYTVKIDELKGVLLSIVSQLGDEELANVMDELGVDFEWYDDLFKLFKEVISCVTK
jgi:hypothetical protein|nr:MAG TPA: hypothetical protein [Caudoviricetes sp.]